MIHRFKIGSRSSGEEITVDLGSFMSAGGVVDAAKAVKNYNDILDLLANLPDVSGEEKNKVKKIDGKELTKNVKEKKKKFSFKPGSTSERTVSNNKPKKYVLR